MPDLTRNWQAMIEFLVNSSLAHSSHLQSIVQALKCFFIESSEPMLLSRMSVPVYSHFDGHLTKFAGDRSQKFSFFKT
jgi:hypothetical protein